MRTHITLINQTSIMYSKFGVRSSALWGELMPTVSLIHVKQRHLSPVNSKQDLEENLDSIAESQLKVAHAILKNPRAIVLLASLHTTLNSENRLLSSMYEPVNMFFPERSIPESINSLSNLQKQVLCKVGGARVIFLLGLVQCIYKTADKSLTEKHDKMVPESDYSYSCIFGEREITALDHALSAVDSLQGDEITVLLVYGGIHDFEKVVEEYKSPSIRYAGEIDCVTSSFRFPPQKKNRIIGGVGLESLNARLKQCPGNVSARISRAQLLEKKGEFPEALLDYRYVNERYPENLPSKTALERLSSKSGHSVAFFSGTASKAEQGAAESAVGSDSEQPMAKSQRK